MDINGRNVAATIRIIGLTSEKNDQPSYNEQLKKLSLIIHVDHIRYMLLHVKMAGKSTRSGRVKNHTV